MQKQPPQKRRASARVASSPKRLKLNRSMAKAVLDLDHDPVVWWVSNSSSITFRKRVS